MNSQQADTLHAATTNATDTVVAHDTATIVVPVQPVPQPKTVVTAAPPAWHDGLDPVPRPGHAGHDQGVVAIIVLLMLAISVSFNNVKRILGNLTKQLSNTRVRENFNDLTTGSETRTILLLLIQAIVFMALLTTSGLSLLWPGSFANTLINTLIISGLITIYFVFQYAAYMVVGYTFTTTDGRRLWIQGFTASMTLLGLILIVPGLAMLFYPAITVYAVWAAAALYLIARILFIAKGFRIFYTNFGSIIYFILYLCTLEIIPVILLLYTAHTFCTKVL